MLGGIIKKKLLTPLYGKHSASGVFWQQRKGIDLARFNKGSGTCGLIG
jgi:hypothetical protein